MTPKLDVSISDSGELKGIIEVTEMWTYRAMSNPDGTSYSEGQDVIMTNGRSGETATATGHGPGKRITSSGKMMRYAIALFCRTVNSTDEGKKLAFLNNIVGVNEYELAQLGNYNHKLWNGNNKRKNRHDAIWV